MADNQMVKIVFDFDLGNVPASAKKLSQYLKDNNLDLKFTKKSVDDLAASMNQLSTAQTKAAQAGAAAGNSIKKSNMQWTNFALVIQDLPYGFRGIQNNLPALMGGIAGMAGPLYLVGSAIIALFTAWDAGLFKTKNATNALKDAQKEYNETLKTSMGSAGEEIAKMNALVSIAGNQEVSMDKRLKAVKKLQDEYPSYFGNLDKEKILNGDVATATDGVKTAIIERAKATAVASKINKLAAEKFAKDEELYQLALQKTARVQAAVNFVKQFPSSAKHLKGLIDASVGGIRDQENAIKSFVNSIDKELKRLEGIYTTTETGAIGLDNGKGGKKGKTPEEVAKEKAKLVKVANDAETKAYLEGLDERAKKEFQAGLDLQDGLEKMKAAGFKNSEIYYDSYRLNMANIAKYYDDKELEEAKKIEDKLFTMTLDMREKLQQAIAKINANFSNQRIKEIDAELAATLRATKGNYNAQVNAIQKAIDKLQQERDAAAAAGISTQAFDDKINALKHSLEGLVDPLENFNTQLTNIINSTLTNLGTALGEGLGNIFAEKGGLTEMLNSFITILADGLISIGKLAIQTGITLLGLEAALKTLGGAGAIVVGVAAVALGTFMKGKIQETSKFANGGIISGPTMGLMGEYPGASSNPEVVAPLDKLKSIIGEGGGGGGTFVLRGQDLLLSVQKAQKFSKLKGQNINLV